MFPVYGDLVILSYRRIDGETSGMSDQPCGCNGNLHRSSEKYVSVTYGDDSTFEVYPIFIVSQHCW